MFLATNLIGTGRSRVIAYRISDEDARSLDVRLPAKHDMLHIRWSILPATDPDISPAGVRTVCMNR